MKKSLHRWQLAGFLFTGIAGTLLHFAYDWSGQSAFFAPFSAINESIWEHMKLLFFPMFVFALVENHYWGGQYENFWFTKLAGILSGLVLIPVLYYTYTGILGVSRDWVNIAIFFVAVAFAYLLETWLFVQKSSFCLSPQTALISIYLLALLFVILTFAPPHIPLFRDPATERYGITKSTG